MQISDQVENAKVIAEKILDQTRRALLEEDFDAYKQAFLLPHIHTTLDGTAFLDTMDDLKMLHTRMTQLFASMGVDDIHRVILSAEFSGASRVLVQIEVHHLRGGCRVNKPYHVTAELVRCGQQWRIGSANYMVDHHNAAIADALMPRYFPSEQPSLPQITDQPFARQMNLGARNMNLEK